MGKIVKYYFPNPEMEEKMKYNIKFVIWKTLYT